jgi:hypothetical protein
MMRMLAILLLLVATARAQRGVRYEVHRASAPIAVDGEANEPAWSIAEKPSVNEAAPRVLWDDANLYLFFTCRDGNGCTVGAAGSHAENGCLAQIKIDPDPEQTDAYIGFRVSPAAQVETFVSFGENYIFHNLRSQSIRASVYMEHEAGRQGWTLEIAIPWSNFQDLNRKHGVGQIWIAQSGCVSETASSIELVFVP